jgi:membrane protein required for colicin V production
MSALDIALTVILAYFLIRGIFRGLVKEVVGILGLFVAFWAASVYWSAGADQLKPVIDSETYRAVLSFVVIYLIVYFLVGLMSVFVDKIVKITVTPVSSGLAGAGLGLLKGATLCVIVLAASTSFLRPDNNFYTDSWAWPKARPMCDRVKEWMPETLRKLMGLASMVTGSLDPQPSQPSAPARPAAPAASSPSPAGSPARPTDFQSLVSLLDAYGGQITPAWRERLGRLTPAEVNPELILTFIRDNPGLFAPGGQGTGLEVAQPSWPTPASE